MKNRILEDIKTYIVNKLRDSYGYVGLADGDNTAMINTNGSKGRDIIIVIKEIDKASAKKEKTKKISEKSKKKIVEGIWSDICERSRAFHFLEGCDEDIQKEIKQSWIDIIGKINV